MSTFTPAQNAYRFYEDSTEAHANCLVPDADGTRFMPCGGAVWADTPDTATVSITGDIDIRVQAMLSDWTPSVGAIVAAKDDGSANREWHLVVNTDGTLLFRWWDSGGTLRACSSNAMGLADGLIKWVRVTLDVDNGASGHTVVFYTSDDGSTWVTNATTNAGAFTTSIRDQSAKVSVGADSGGAGGSGVTGGIYYAEVRNGIGGTVAAEFRPATDGADAGTTMVAGTGETWTMRGTQSIAAQSTAATVYAAWRDRRLLLRIRIQETGGKSGATTDDWQLQYSKDGGAFTSITTSTSNVKGFGSVALTDAGTTTQQLTAGTGSFVAGEISESGLVTDRQLTASNFTELLYTLQLVDADINGKASFTFRTLFNGATFTYNVTPTLTVLSNLTAASSAGAATATASAQSTASADLSSTGASTATAEGLSTVPSSAADASSAGAATGILAGQSQASATLNSAGAALGTAAGKSTATSSLSAAGTGTGAAVGKSLSQSALATTGAATATADTKTLASASLNSAGASVGTLEGSSTASFAAAGDIIAAGMATATAAASALADGAMSAAGTATAVLGGASLGGGNTVVSLGARPKRRVETDDEADLLAMLSSVVAQLEVARQQQYLA